MVSEKNGGIKMKFVKKLVTLLTICTFFVTATACANNGWAIKGEGESLSTRFLLNASLSRSNAKINSRR